MQEEEKDKKVKAKSKKFKYFIGVLIFIGFVMFLSTVKQATKTEFEACYDKCSRLGRAPGEDGKCSPDQYLRGNWCIQHGQANKCITRCKK